MFGKIGSQNKSNIRIRFSMFSYPMKYANLIPGHIFYRGIKETLMNDFYTLF
jgi:hypothetical protein